MTQLCTINDNSIRRAHAQSLECSCLQGVYVCSGAISALHVSPIELLCCSLRSPAVAPRCPEAAIRPITLIMDMGVKLVTGQSPPLCDTAPPLQAPVSEVDVCSQVDDLTVAHHNHRVQLKYHSSLSYTFTHPIISRQIQITPNLRVLHPFPRPAVLSRRWAAHVRPWNNWYKMCVG
jgi:hypothetical protein